MTKLTLDRAWELCLQHRAWITEQIEAGSEKCILTLKEEWCAEHGFKNVKAGCFFCEYAEQNRSDGEDDCVNCPGRLIDPSFHCGRPEYDYEDEPIKFNAKLIELNKIRTGQ